MKVFNAHSQNYAARVECTVTRKYLPHSIILVYLGICNVFLKYLLALVNLLAAELLGTTFLLFAVAGQPHEA